MSSAGLIRTEALLLKKTVHRESDAFVILFTQDLGRISAGARGAQRSQKRFGGALEPVHTLRVELVKRRTDHYELRSARVERPRLHLTQSLELLQAAGRALGWIRQAAMERAPEPLVWSIATRLLDQLDATAAPPTAWNVAPDATSGTLARDTALTSDSATSDSATSDSATSGSATSGSATSDSATSSAARGLVHLAEAGLALLNAWGWALELLGCIHCGRPCPNGRAAYVDARRGGLVCSGCGGAGTRIEGDVRMRLLAATRGSAFVLSPADAPLALGLTEAALSAHADIG